MNNIQRVIRFMTSDGEEHPSLEEAQWHEQMLENCEGLSDWLRATEHGNPLKPMFELRIRQWEKYKIIRVKNKANDNG